MITAERAPQHYIASFTEFERRAVGSHLPWLRELRREAFARFCEAGFPTTHDEDWRFTSVSAIANAQFEPAPERHSAISAAQLAPWRREGAGCQLVFVNGRLAPELSLPGPLPGGVTVTGLAQALSLDGSLVEQHLGHYLDQNRDSFAALNTAFAEDGAYVHVPRGVVVEEPVWLLFLSTGNGLPLMNYPRNLILVDEQSEIAIVEEYVSLRDGSALSDVFCNSVTELVAGDNAVVSHYRIEREQAGTRNISTLRIQQGRSTNIATHSVLLGGALVRNNVHTVLAGEGGECLINGLFLGGGDEHIDNYMLVEHASPHCGSRQFYNGILDGKAHGVFHGRIIVHKDAQKTDAKQTNRNLLLSDDAQIDTKPQLEIHADDVKCTHGATIGQIDEEALFYLRSRGIGEVSARRLLLLAFAGECMARMKEGPARRHIEALVNQSVLRITGASASDGGLDGVVKGDDAAAPALAQSAQEENASAANQAAAAAQPGASGEEAVWAELRSVFDPEIPANIVDLGLIYACTMTPLPDSGNKVEVKMTLTAPGCALAGAIKEEVERKLARLPGVREVRVELVFDPPWEPGRMTEAARLQLGLDADFGGRNASSGSSGLPIWKPGK